MSQESQLNTRYLVKHHLKGDDDKITIDSVERYDDMFWDEQSRQHKIEHKVGGQNRFNTKSASGFCFITCV